MPRRVPIKRGQSFFTGDRVDVAGINAKEYELTQTENILGSHQDSIEQLTTDRLLATDASYYAYWPCTDAFGSTLLRQDIAGGPGPLTCGANIVPGYVGVPSSVCVRVEEGAGATYAATVSPSNPTMTGVTIALWAKLGSQPAANRNIFGWHDTVAGDLTGIFQSYTLAGQHRMAAYVTVGGVLYTATFPASTYFGAGEWHHIGMTYDGETLLGYIDGNAMVSDTTPTGAPSWSTGGGTKSWRLGSGSGSSQSGFYADIRVIPGAQPESWFAEAYKRGVRSFYG